MNKFKFHPVGQGLFYTGSIASGRFNFVYDCGTESRKHYLHNAIDSYFNELSFNSYNPSIDFVVISHLHSDHFNGLWLLSKKIKIDKVYLPYLGKNKSIIKIILYKKLVMGVKIGDKNSKEFEDLAYRVACQLYGVSEERYFPNIGEPKFLGVEPNNFDEKGFCYSKHEDKLTIGTKDYWKFFFVNKTISNEKLNELLDNLKREINDFENKSLEKIIELDGGIEAIDNAYKNTFGDNQNITSTLLYHHPVHDLYVGWVDCGKMSPVYCKEGCCAFNCQRNLRKNTTLLTGDAEFDKGIKKELNYLESLGMFNKEVGVIQIPHHGSKYNWEKMNDMGIKSIHNVVSFGLGNSYHHPNEKVVNNILKNNQKLWIANQIGEIKYKIKELNFLTKELIENHINEIDNNEFESVILEAIKEGSADAINELKRAFVYAEICLEPFDKAVANVVSKLLGVK